jgi:hypothetical protein
MKSKTKVWVNISGPMDPQTAKAVRAQVQEVCNNSVDFEFEQPEICQKQYQTLDDTLGNLADVVDRIRDSDYGFSDANNEKQVRADIKRVRALLPKVDKAKLAVEVALQKLEDSIEEEVRKNQ